MYNKYAAYINPLLKFFLALFILLVINAKIGNMDRINDFSVVLIAALFCSFMPLTVMAVIGMLFVLLHTYSMSIECAIVAAVVIFLMFILFIRFTPKEAIIVLLTPVLFMMKIPYIMPVAVGLLGTPASVISLAFGVILSYIVGYTADNAEKLAAMGDETLVTRLRMVIDGMVANKDMIVVIIVFGIIVMTVYLIRRLSIDYSWKYASIAGGILTAIIMTICELILGMGYSVIGILIGSLLAVAVGFLLDFLALDLDYRGTENLQFEDDDYYYYVKAIPKAGSMNKTRKSAARRDVSRGGSSGRSSGQHTVRTANGVRRTTD